MSILVVGVIAYDTVKTPVEIRHEVLGGPAVYFSLAASHFSPVSVTAVVGSDFHENDLQMLRDHEVDVTGVRRVQGGKTFRWVAEYGERFDEAHTLDTQLNVFADFKPSLLADARRSPFLFLANLDPDLQWDVFQQLDQRPMLVATDTMNLWINDKNDSLQKVIKISDTLLINEAEIKQLTGEMNVVKAAQQLLDQGPSMIVVKRGQYGSMFFTSGEVFAAPAYPLETVVDPTGAGDTFAGGFLGYLAGCNDISIDSCRRALIVGTVMASFAVESFGPERLSLLTGAEIEERYAQLWRLTYFDQSGDRKLPLRSVA